MSYAGNTGDDNGTAANDNDQPIHQAGNLDDVHDRIMSEHGNELSQPNNLISTDEDEDEDEDETSTGDKTDEDEDEEIVEDDEDELDDKNKPEPPEQMDSDLTKPGKYKAEFTDIDGNKLYVNSIDDLPDDYEPLNRRAELKSMEDLRTKQQLAAEDQKAYNEAQSKEAQQAEADNLIKSWDSDIERLSKNGIVMDDGYTLQLPKDEKQRNETIEAVYKMMDAENKAGRSIYSWAQGFEIYQQRQAAAQTRADKIKADEDKKNAGARIMGGGNNAGESTQSKKSGTGGVRKSPPMGTTLDQIHQQRVGSL